MWVNRCLLHRMFWILLAFAPTTALSAAADEIVVHVAADGNDSSDGTASQPFATLGHALEAAQGLAGKNPDSDIRILVRSGVYRIAAPLTVSPTHVPANGSLTISAPAEERVVISGGRTITGWRVEDDGSWTTSIPEVAAGKWRFRELFVNDQRRPRARHPNAGYLRIDESFPDKRSGFSFHAGDLPHAWTGGGELVFLHDWSISRMPVKSVEHDTRRLTSAHSIGNRADHYKIDHFEKHPRYYVENHPTFLDAAGEWLLDEAAGQLTYRPLSGESPESVEVVAPLVDKLLVVAGDDTRPVRNFHIQNIDFSLCGWQLPAGGYASGQATAYERRDGTPQQFSRTFIPPAIHFARAESCSFRDSRIAHLGTSGIAFGSQTRDCRLENCVIEDVSGNGVNLGEDTTRIVDSRPWWQAAPGQVATGHMIDGNKIRDCGRQFFGAVAVWAGLTRGVKITNNEIARHPYTGVSLGWMWNPTPTPAAENVVADNHIHHVMQVLSDGGGIYTLGRQPGTRLVNNVIHDVPLNAGRAESNGMFLDQGSDQILIQGNMIYRIDRSPLRFHQAKQITVRENVLVVADPTVPPLRYNNTDPQTVTQIDNRVVLESEFQPPVDID